MARKAVLKLLAACSLLLISISVSAHHGNAAYDLKKITVKATVTRCVRYKARSALRTASVKGERLSFYGV